MWGKGHRLGTPQNTAGHGVIMRNPNQRKPAPPPQLPRTPLALISLGQYLLSFKFLFCRQDSGSGTIQDPLLLYNPLAAFSLGKFIVEGTIRSTNLIRSTFNHLLGSVLSSLTHIVTTTSKYIL